MADTKLRKLPIERGSFEMAFERDVNYAEHEDHAILDRETGELIWFYEEGEDAEFAAGLDHGDHHDILRAFLRSGWTEDENLWHSTYDLYTGSIGRWKKALRDRRVLDAYHAFRDRRIAELAEDFLREHGIAPDWA